MSVVTRYAAVGLVFGLLAGTAPALAQAPADASGSSWTDPPVRGSAGPDAPAAVKPSEAKPVAKSSADKSPADKAPADKASADAKAPAAAEAPPAAEKKPRRSAAAPTATPAERAAARLGVRPVEASGVAAMGQARRSVVRPRMVERPLILARRPARIMERTVRRPVRLARPTIRSYAYAPEPREDGRGYAGTWSRRRLAGWSGLIEESPASRVARARESGYLVMRMRTYAYPDGTFARRLSPYDEAD